MNDLDLTDIAGLIILWALASLLGPAGIVIVALPVLLWKLR